MESLRTLFISMINSKDTLKLFFRNKKEIKELQKEQIICFVVEWLDHNKSISGIGALVGFVELLRGLVFLFPELLDEEMFCKSILRILYEQLIKQGKESHKGICFQVSLLIKRSLKVSEKLNLMLTAFIKRLDVKSIDSFYLVLKEIMNDNIRGIVEEKIKEGMLKFENISWSLTGNLVGLLTIDFLKEFIIIPLRRNLKKSIATIPSISNFLIELANSKSQLPKSSIVFEEMMEQFLIDYIVKQSDSSYQLIIILCVVLKGASVNGLTDKIINFILSISKQIKESFLDCKFKLLELIFSFTLSDCNSENKILLFKEIFMIGNLLCSDPKYFNKVNSIIRVASTNFSLDIILEVFLTLEWKNKPDFVLMVAENCSLENKSNLDLISFCKNYIKDCNIKNLSYDSASISSYLLYCSLKKGDTELALSTAQWIFSRVASIYNNSLTKVICSTNFQLLSNCCLGIDSSILSLAGPDKIRQLHPSLTTGLVLCRVASMKLPSTEFISHKNIDSIVNFVFAIDKIISPSEDVSKLISTGIHLICQISKKGLKSTSAEFYSKLACIVYRYSCSFPELKKITSYIEYVELDNEETIDHFSLILLSYYCKSTDYYFKEHLMSSITLLLAADKNLTSRLAFLIEPKIMGSLQKMKSICTILLQESTDPRDFIINEKDKEFVFKVFGDGILILENKHTLLQEIQELTLSTLDERESRLTELSLYSHQDLIFENYSKILNCVIESFKNYVIFQNNKKIIISEEKNMCPVFSLMNLMKESIRTKAYMSSQLEYFYVFCMTLKHKKLPFINELSIILLAVIKDDLSLEIGRKMEDLVKTQNLSIMKNSSDLCDITFEILVFSFKLGIDSETQRSLFSTVHSFIEVKPNLKTLFFTFICNNINDLGFQEAARVFEALFSELLVNDKNLEDFVLVKVLDMEPHAQELVLNTLLKLSQRYKELGSHTEPIQKLKLLIVSENEDEKISGLAKSLLSISNNFSFSAESFIQLKFDQIIVDFPFDIHVTIGKIFFATISKLNKESISKCLSLIIESATTLVSNSTVNSADPTFELKLKQTPAIVKICASLLSQDHVIKYFDYMAIVESKKLNSLQISALESFETLMETKPEYVTSICQHAISMIAKQINIVTSVKVLKECILVSRSIVQAIPNISKSIKSIGEISNKSLMIPLIDSLPIISNLIEDVKTEITKNLNKAVDCSDRDQQECLILYSVCLLRGMGHMSLEETGVITKIEEIVKSTNARDLNELSFPKRYFVVGCIDSICRIFGRSIEPKLIRVLDPLLKLLSSNNEEVRQKCKEVLGLIISRISGRGVYLLLQQLTMGVTDASTRGKVVCIEALGQLNRSGTRQLSLCLPRIVGRLTSSMNDSNLDIKGAAESSMNQILETVRNPEIASSRDTLIKSLSNPYSYNDRALDLLAQTRFEHSIDGPALTLVMQVIFYALKFGRSDQSKIRAASIVATILNLIPDDDDFLVHANSLIDALSISLVDIESEVRAVTAKAFHSISLRFASLRPVILKHLQITMNSLTVTSIQRAGCAQAFSEILSTLSIEDRTLLVNQCLELTCDSREAIRESYLSVMIYLPMILGEEFRPLIDVTISSVIESISHESDKVRNLAIKCIKIIIKGFLRKDPSSLVGPLVEGVFSEKQVRRLSSIILLGDLLEILNENEDNGEPLYETHSRIFTAMYIAKSDANAEVRSAANNMFKIFVSAPQRCLRGILSELITCYSIMLSKDSLHLNELALSSLEEFTTKYGEFFLGVLISQVELLRGRTGIEGRKGLCIFLCYFIRFYPESCLTPEIKTKLFDELFDFFSYDEKQIWMQSLGGLRNIIEKSSDVSFLDEILSNGFPDLKTIINDTLSYEKITELFCCLLETRWPRLSSKIIKILVVQEAKEWQLDVMLRKADDIARLMYKTEGLESGADVLLSILFNVEKDNESLAKEAVLQILAATDLDITSVIIEDLTRVVEKLTSDKDIGKLITIINLLSRYFEESVEEVLKASRLLILRCFDLVSFEMEGNYDLFVSLGAFLTVIFEESIEEAACQMMRDVYGCVNSLIVYQKQITGIKHQDIISAIVGLSTTVLTAYQEEIAVIGLRTLELLIDNIEVTSFKNVKQSIYVSFLQILCYNRLNKPSDDLVLGLFRTFIKFLNKGLIPEKIDDIFLLQLILILNNESSRSVLFEEVTIYLLTLITISKKEFILLDLWMSNIKNDKYYHKDKLSSFIEKCGDKRKAFQIYVNELNK